MKGEDFINGVSGIVNRVSCDLYFLLLNDMVSSSYNHEISQTNFLHRVAIIQ